MNLTPTVALSNSTLTIPAGASVAPVNLGNVINFSIMLRRPMSITEYADGVIAGTNKILSYVDFCNQFNSLDTDISLISDFATATGFTIVDSHAPSATIKLSGTVSQINSAFGITLNTVTIADRSYMSYDGTMHIPSVLDTVIEYVLGLDFSVTISREAVPYDGSISQTAVSLTPPQVATAYNFPAGDGYGVCVGIMEWGGGWTTSNLTSSFSPLGLSNPTITSVLTDGGTNNPGDNNGSPEVMLDIYCAAGVAPKARYVTYFGYGAGSSSPTAGSNWYNNFNTAIHDTTNSPSVLSTSWGAGETSYWNSTYVSATDNVLAQAVTLGITILVSSGDSGSTWGQSTTEVLYPSSSRYVTACGGTSLQLSGSSRSTEVAWTDSGGGLSTYQSIQSWQSGLTYTTYSTGGVSGSATTLTVRGVPDIAGNADPNTGYTFNWGNSNTRSQYGGTSAVCPLMAGMVARLNQLTGNRLGFANTFFYANPSAFTDITSGENAVYVNGYKTTSGWDAVTGLGVPIGTTLYKLMHTGSTFPKQNFGFRGTGPTYPRITQGARTD